jgi:hypothetical protein
MAVKNTFFFEKNVVVVVVEQCCTTNSNPSHNFTVVATGLSSSRFNGVRLEATVWRCLQKVLVKKSLGWLEELVGWKFDVRFN